MMKTSIKKYMKPLKKSALFMLILVLFYPLQIQAQVEDMKTDEEVMVIAPFNPNISKARKINFSPVIDTSRNERLQIDYLTQPMLFKTNYSVEKLTAAKFIDRRTPKYAQNYLRGGYGLYNTAYGELFINSNMSKASQVGIHLRHFSTNGGLDDYAYNGTSLNSAKVWTKHIQRKQSTHVAVDYQRNHIHRYGFLKDDYPLLLAATENDFKEDIKQTYSHVGFNLDMKGTFDTKFRDWQVKTAYQYFWDRFKTQEHLLDLTAYYEHPVDWIDVKSQHIGVEFSTQTYYSTLNYNGLFPAIDSTSNYFHGLYDLTPYYQLKWESISLELGAKLSMGLDSNSRVAVAPRVKLDVGLMADQLRLYINADGGFKNNSMAHFAEENHFITPLVPLKYSQNTYLIQLGLKGHYQSYLDYHIFAETSSFKDMPMFITDTTSQFDNSFTVIYDGGQYIGAGAEVQFQTERWNVELLGKYQSYTMDTASRAWQKPALLYKLKVGYYVLENLKVTALLLGQSKMYHLYKGEQSIEPWMDFSLMADYHLNQNLGFFVKATNIFSDQYQIWYNYPVQSIGFMGGLHFAF